MLITPHILIGLYLASSYQPIFAWPAAFVSHLIFDFFYPHWNPHIYSELKNKGHFGQNTLKTIAADLFISLIITLIIMFKNIPNTQIVISLMVAGFMSILPDLLVIPFFFFKSKNGILKKIINFEHKYQADAGKFWGLISQLFIIILCLWQIFK